LLKDTIPRQARRSNDRWRRHPQAGAPTAGVCGTYRRSRLESEFPRTAGPASGGALTRLTGFPAVSARNYLLGSEAAGPSIAVDTERIMKIHAPMQAFGALGICAAIAICSSSVTTSTAQNAGQAQAGSEAAPIYGVTIPPGYRDWHLISVKQLIGAGGKLKQLRAQLGNEIAIKAFREGRLPFPDGSIIAALHWNEVSSDADNKVLAEGFPGVGLESSFAGDAVNVQFMVKDSKKYASSGGWGFADFTNGKPGDEALHEKCWPCHQPGKDRDYVFTRYAPTP
jgi:Cytochrome P460